MKIPCFVQDNDLMDMVENGGWVHWEDHVKALAEKAKIIADKDEEIGKLLAQIGRLQSRVEDLERRTRVVIADHIDTVEM